MTCHLEQAALNDHEAGDVEMCEEPGSTRHKNPLNEIEHKGSDEDASSTPVADDGGSLEAKAGDGQQEKVTHLRI